jgi:muramidase (phage lysozyme)
MSTFAGKDNCTDIILDLISERESGGHYNAVIGNAEATDDLSQKTLAEIYALMNQLLDEGRPSSAVGRYQIIHGTLLTLQHMLGLPMSTLFTRELQDSLAWHLLIGRGYPRWWLGAMSDVDFAHGLSEEWASLPDPDNAGKSHYDGVGPNHAGMTLEHVYDALGRARASKPDVNHA